MSDGRYRYKYVDSFEEEKYVYSWKLDRNDRMPAGKKAELSLREKEKQIAADIFDQIVPDGGRMTVITLVEKYVSLKTGVRPSTEAGYRTVLNLLEKEEFGHKRIDKVKLSDAKVWLIQLQKKGRGFSTIRTIRGILSPAFQMAVDDDLIRKNPFGFELATVIYNDSVTRESLTREQERKFLQFVKEDNHFKKYYDGIYILLNTGLRISEFVGLTKKDIDFKEMKINVDHQLQRYGRIGYKIVEPKTDSGVRQIPMTPEVAECFRRIMKTRKKPKTEPIIDGYAGFLFLDKDNHPMAAMHWEKYFQHICQKYNKIYKVQMPKVTPHVCRHTFCSRMAAARMNPKTLQYIMGHSDIGVTLNTYTHLGFEEASEELRRLSVGE
ncbi:MAG: site-specific integrase [Lachnospiraceae bacterium]|nr:site-specific integrase [Lachnospiraceae bacterium]